MVSQVAPSEAELGVQPGSANSAKSVRYLVAVHAFERIETRVVAKRSAALLTSNPPTVQLPAGGYAMCMRYGVVVFANADGQPATDFLSWLDELGNKRQERALETELLSIVVEPEQPERVLGDALHLSDASLARLVIAAEVLARSVVMASYEAILREAAAAVEPLARELESTGRSAQRPRTLLRHIGRALSIRQALIGRAEVTEKPDLLWERTDLERLYHQLLDEFEIEERNRALEAKLGLVTDVAHTGLDLVRHRSSLRVEWYIVLLIVFDILLSLFKLG